jgi:beta-lactamase regulating signal transducer with metallopeptidase domain
MFLDISVSPKKVVKKRYNKILSGLQQHSIWLTTTSCLAYNNIISGLQQHPVWLTTTSCLAYNNIPFWVVSGFIYSTVQSAMNLPRAVVPLVKFNCLPYDWMVKDEIKLA